MPEGSTNFPTSLDSNAVAAGGKTTEITSTLYNNHSIQIEALENKVGIDSSADTDSHDYKIANIDLTSAWPIGSIYLSVVATNPATLIGFGTWEAYSKGKVLVGIDAGGDADFDTVEETGGSKTMSHTHTTPDHTHTTSDHTHTVSNHTHSLSNHTHGFSGTTSGASGSASYSGNDSNPTYLCARIGHNHTYSGNTGGPSNNTSGGSAPGTSGASAGNTTSGANTGNTTSAASNESNLQPYTTVYMWKRTA